MRSSTGSGIMRAARLLQQASRLRRHQAPSGSPWWRRGLGRPLAVGLALLAIAGLTTVVRSLLDLGAAVPAAEQRGWPTAVAGSLVEPVFGPALLLPEPGGSRRDSALEADLARLKEGDFGVAFEARRGGPPVADATVPVAPVVLIDTARPPLRLDIMGLAADQPGRRLVERNSGAAPETTP